jgi:hypothetical protein
MMCLYVISVVVFFHLFVRDLRVLWEDWLQWRVRHLQHILIAIELEEHPNHLDKPLYINSIVGVKTSSLHIFTLASAILSLSLSLSLSLQVQGTPQLHHLVRTFSAFKILSLRLYTSHSAPETPIVGQ